MRATEVEAGALSILLAPRGVSAVMGLDHATEAPFVMQSSTDVGVRLLGATFDYVPPILPAAP
ncbi:hypothetical protein Ntsu_41270 [Nocardia sp. IFM 10818]